MFCNNMHYCSKVWDQHFYKNKLLLLLKEYEYIEYIQQDVKWFKKKSDSKDILLGKISILWKSLPGFNQSILYKNMGSRGLMVRELDL